MCDSLRPGRGQHLGRPAALADVQPQRAGGVGSVARLLAGHEQADVVLGQQHAARVLEHRRFVLAHPDELGRRETRHGDVAGDLPAARLGLLERGALLFAATIVPENGRDAAACRRRRAAWRRASGPRGPRPSRPCAAFAGSALTAALVALHQSAGFCSDHPACGRETLSGADACSTTVSLSSTRTALTLDVPISMPRYIRPSLKNRGGNATTL